MDPHFPFPVQHMEAAFSVHGLRFLIHDAAVHGDIKYDQPVGIRVDAFALPQRREDLALRVEERFSHVIAVCVEQIVVVLRPIGPGIGLVSSRVGIVDTFILDEVAVGARDVNPTVSIIDTIGVRAILLPCEELSQVCIFMGSARVLEKKLGAGAGPGMSTGQISTASLMCFMICTYMPTR